MLRRGGALTALQEAVERLRITEVWRACGGEELRHGRGRAFWRDARDFNVALDAEKGLWHDFVTDEGGNAVGLVTTALKLTPGEAARWLIELAGIEDKPLTRAARLERHTVEQDIEDAHLFAVAAAAIAEHCLEVDSVFDPARHDLVDLIADLGRDPLGMFRTWRRDYPKLTRGLILSGRRELERREMAGARELREVLNNAA